MKYICMGLLSCSIISTQATTLTNSTQFYIDGSIGYASITNWNSASAALNVNAGYNFNPNFALETGYTYVVPQTNYNNGIFYTANQSWTDFAAKGSIRISPIATLYVKGGIAMGFSSSSVAVPNLSYATGNEETNIALLSGMGLTLSPIESLKFKAETYGIIPFSNTAYGNVSVFSIGAEYSF